LFKDGGSPVLSGGRYGSESRTEDLEDTHHFFFFFAMSLLTSSTSSRNNGSFLYSRTMARSSDEVNSKRERRPIADDVS
jgi:hypothetical protein